MLSKVNTCDTKCLWSLKKTPNKKQKAKANWVSSVLHGDQRYFVRMYFFVIPDDDIQYVYKKTTLSLLNNIVFHSITSMLCLDSYNLSKIGKEL